MKRVNVGDIIEIKTKKGLFYAQYTHKHNEMGVLIQVTKYSFANRPNNILDILECEIGLITFFQLSVSLRNKTVEIIGNKPVPNKRKAFPTFRVRGDVNREGKVLDWKFWNGEKSWPDEWLKELTDEQFKLPIRGMWNDKLLIKRLETGWLPKDYAGN